MASVPRWTIELLQKTWRRGYWIATLTALTGAGLLIYWELTARTLWVDEEMILLNVRDRAFAQLAGPLWLDQSGPLGWLALERLVLLTLGSGERAVRLVTVLFGVGTLGTAVWIGHRWMTPFGASMLALLCSIGQWLVFFTLELKHYSADAFWALFLPALGAWALEQEDGWARRLAVWWAMAIVGQWFGNGALFVTPACAVVLFIECWRRRGWRGAFWVSIAGLVWLASFGLDYRLVLRHALGNTYLQNYWAFAFPPSPAGVVGTLHWLLDEFAPFAVKPAGSGLWAMFWVAFASGIIFAIATRRAYAARGQSPAAFGVTPDFHPGLLGLMLATVPVSALALAVLHLVPTFERLTSWVVPALYAGVGLCADASLWLVRPPSFAGGPHGRERPPSLWLPPSLKRRRTAVALAEAGQRDLAAGSSKTGRTYSRRRAIGLAFALAAGVAASVVCVDIFERGADELAVRPRSNYGLDDRRSVRWLMAVRRPGDVLMTTHFGLAAIWWYGRLNISGPDRGGILPDGSPIFEVGHLPPGRDCDQRTDEMNAALSGHSRVLVYLGFRLNVEPPGFDGLVLETLSRRGALVGYQPYAEESRIAVFDLGQAPLEKLTLPLGHPTGIPAVAGCVAIKPARRW